MADDERPAVGTVAEEAARLLDALGGWATTARNGYAAPAADEEPVTEPVEKPVDDPVEQPVETPVDEAAASSTSRCATCGAEDGAGRALACQLCPVCQGIALLRSVRPETVDRLADLAGALAATLRDIAGQRRADAGTQSPSPSPSQSPKGPSNRTSSARVQDIVVDDEDTPGSATS